MKSSNTLMKAEYTEQLDEPEDEAFFDWMEDDETFEVTRNILKEKEPPIAESVIHKGDRPVTLVDLLNALENVEGEVEKKKLDRKERLRARSEMDKSNRSNIDRKMYKENVEEEIKLTWQRVNQFNGHPISFDKIHSDFELDPTTVFVSLLFLAKWNRIRIWQRKFPHGEIFIKNTSPGEDLKFGDLEENLDRAKKSKVKIPEGEELVVEKKEIPSNWNT
jgi:chromatin segregation and condensation protein Rec8/ScpA/Scc1 (kleisin family)